MTKFRPEEKNVVYVGEGVTVIGEIHAQDVVVVDGTVDGEITCDQLIVGVNGVVNGKVAVLEAAICGRIGTEVSVNQLLVVRSTGRVEGKWVYGEVEVEKGGVLSGEAESTGFRSSDRKSDKEERAAPAHIKKSETPIRESSTAKGEPMRVPSLATRVLRERNKFV
jgi:cytoskeletal protein CcmA (bactofilin family)